MTIHAHRNETLCRPIGRHAIVLLVLLGGCSAGNLRVKAATDLRCPQDQIQVQKVEYLVEKVTGCGREDLYASRDGATWMSALDRGAFDLSCAREQLSARHLGGRAVGVTGCGKKTVYVYVHSVGWMVNTVDQTRPGP